MIPKENVIKLKESDIEELVGLFTEGKEPGVQEIRDKLDALAFRKQSRVNKKPKKKHTTLMHSGLKSLLLKMKSKSPLTGKDLEYCKSIADSYMVGEGVRKNVQKAYNFFKWAADSGDIFSQYNVAIIAKEHATEISEKDTTSIYKEYLIKSADGGFYEAQKLLAEYCYLGICEFEIDYVKTVHYAEKIKDKNTGAKFTLADCYTQGLGVEKDEAKGFALYQELATKDNCTVAYVLLGEAYEKGRGVAKDVNKAFKLYKFAAAKGCVQGKSEQARCLLEGIGVQQDFAEGLGLMESIASGPEPDINALFFLGEFYYDGNMRQNIPKIVNAHSNISKKHRLLITL